MKPPLPDEDIRPTHTPLGVDPEYQAKTLRRLRELENEGRRARFDRDDLMVANSLSNSLSRRDMAHAIGVTKARVDQVLASHSHLLQQRRERALHERTARHLPPAA
jgi:hypothetical protein